MASVDHAIAAIRALDDRAVVVGFRPDEIDRAERGGRLAGEAIVVKDNVAVPGHPMTGGSPVFAGYHEPVGDGIQRLLDDGAVVVATVSLHELAFGVTGDNAWLGMPVNPAAPDRLPGGSSSGPAIAVALGIVDAAIGTDTGGSIRIPAACCGTIGFRPTIGRYPSNGVLTLSPSRDTLGVIASDLATLRRFDSVLAGQTDDDTAHEMGHDTGHGDQPASRSAAGLRIAVLDDDGLARCDDAIAAAYRSWVDECAAGGAEIHPVDITELLAANDEASFPIALRETIEQFHGRASDLGITYGELVASLANDDVRSLMSMEPPPEDARRDALDRVVPAMRAWYAGLFDRCDVLALPTLPTLPPMRHETDMMTVDGVERPTFPTLTTFTSPASLAGVPSLSLPLACPEGPAGLMLEGPVDGDRALLSIAARLFGGGA